jgi:hypothetical protein
LGDDGEVKVLLALRHEAINVLELAVVFLFSNSIQRVCVMICYGKVREQFSAVELR